MKESIILDEQEIKNKIYNIRGLQVMIDNDLAGLYKVKTRVLNQAVKRNIDRFPNNFMFQLNKKEFENWKSQLVTSNYTKMGLRKRPLVFTEQGVAMLSGVLKSDIAVKISVQIINAFVEMRKFLISNAQLFQRLDKAEVKLLEHDNKFDEVFNLIESKDIKPDKRIFFDGQVFDAYKLFSDIIRTANNSILLIDNYIDDSVLTLFSKRKKSVKVTILTKEISNQLSLDLKKYNSQYPKIEIKEFKLSHDRFMIIDNKDVYHLGASLKDLGKKWFAFSKFNKEIFTILNKLEDKNEGSTK